MTGTRVHGHLFSPDRVEYAGGETVYNGAMSDSAKMRDYNPKSFLASLLWNTRGERQCFQFGPRDNPKINWQLASDSNATISVISGAWAVPLFKSNLNFSEIRKEAARLQRLEQEHLNVLRSPWVKARSRIWNLAEFVENPMEPLQTIVDEDSAEWAQCCDWGQRLDPGNPLYGPVKQRDINEVTSLKASDLDL